MPHKLKATFAVAVTVSVAGAAGGRAGFTLALIERASGYGSYWMHQQVLQ